MPYPLVLSTARYQWKELFVAVKLDVAGCYLFKFRDEQAKQHVLDGGPYFFSQKYLVLKDWHRMMKPVKDQPSHIPASVRLYDLPLELWNQECLSRVASTIGKPLNVDQATTKTSKQRGLLQTKSSKQLGLLQTKSTSARVCIEISAKHDLPKDVRISIEDDELEKVLEQKAASHEWIQVGNGKQKVVPYDNLAAPSSPHNISVSTDPTVIQVEELGLEEVTTLSDLKKPTTLKPSDCQGLEQGEEAAILVSNEIIDPYQLLSNTTPFNLCIILLLCAIVSMSLQAFNLGFWNIRGLNGPIKQKEAKSFMSTNKLSIVGFLEHKIRVAWADRITHFICPDWSFVNNYSQAAFGRIFVGWDLGVLSLIVLGQSNQFIHCEVQPKDGSALFLVTMVYGANSNLDRRSLWHSLIQFRNSSPWVVLGDFNAIRHLKEKVGRGEGCYIQLSPHMDDINHCLFASELDDLRFIGCLFTWSNKQVPPHFVATKLDRVLVNEP
ncbi:uncharacterized protein LOC131332805 [Rhododendron vialii]|uniref:uncharacterized protein LOC131332805 n=1 Tax=Rhododendron vialii TaxID=182163 RepID=UPI00265EDB75|nr:uncharacterized protein LOC131332805 [Rhododendron vialii]